MTLKQIVLNRRGMIVAVVVVASSLIGGLIIAFILDLPITTAVSYKQLRTHETESYLIFRSLM
ncbi:transporter [Escherichia coli]|nr:transporter [Escherichia coli]